MNYLNQYVETIKQSGNNDLADSILITARTISSRYIETFDFMHHVTSLLVGNIQSGKTAQMFGVMCAAADCGFGNFILLTTDSILLQRQTLERVHKDLLGFCICDETDDDRFYQNEGRLPVIIVLKKNVRVLKSWKSILAKANFVKGNPIFIVDDEADAASLNTKINIRAISSINKTLREIINTTNCSIYLQVTGTPQANLLQSAIDGWKPYFIHYFEPGRRYIGGNYFFCGTNPYTVLTTENEAEDVIEDDENPENCLFKALIIHIITSAQIFSCGGTVCNFLIHPSSKISQHEIFAEKIGCYMNDVSSMINKKDFSIFDDAYDNLKLTKPDLLPKETLYSKAEELLSMERRSIIVINSNSNLEASQDFKTGMNIIVGGNSLGRGLTFPQLQTIYYCRVSKNPQADTMWQHARMFGYDRDLSLMRIFMPPHLYKLFCEINATNNSIINQIKSQTNKIQIHYPKGLNPTRKNVLNKKKISTFAGGVNYFPYYPQEDIDELDKLLEKFTSADIYSVALQFIYQILIRIRSDMSDWNGKAYCNFIKAMSQSNPREQGILIVRRNRNIAKGTGTLLSPTDRIIGDKIKDKVVLTMYKLTGQKGWDGKEIWIPNIKFPDDIVFYDVDDE